MAAVTSDITPTTRNAVEVLETLAITNAGASGTVARALAVPKGAKAVTFVIDITITGTTPLFDFAVYIGSEGAGHSGATLDSTTDIAQFPTNAAITQLTTDTSSPTVTIDIGPGIPVDTTGSATANSGYSFPVSGLPRWLVYIYSYDGTTHDEDYNGTIAAYWH